MQMISDTCYYIKRRLWVSAVKMNKFCNIKQLFEKVWILSNFMKLVMNNKMLIFQDNSDTHVYNFF